MPCFRSLLSSGLSGSTQLDREKEKEEGRRKRGQPGIEQEALRVLLNEALSQRKVVCGGQRPRHRLHVLHQRSLQVQKTWSRGGEEFHLQTFNSSQTPTDERWWNTGGNRPHLLGVSWDGQGQGQGNTMNLFQTNPAGNNLQWLAWGQGHAVP